MCHSFHSRRCTPVEQMPIKLHKRYLSALLDFRMHSCFIEFFYAVVMANYMHEVQIMCPRSVPFICLLFGYLTTLFPVHYLYSVECDIKITMMRYTISVFYIHGSVHRESNLITAQQDATYSVYYISVGSSTCFGCLHPSSGAHTTVITASGSTDSCVSYDTHESVPTQHESGW